MNMMELFWDGNWVCARDGPWRFPAKFSRWILVRQCSKFFGWKLLGGPRLNDIDKPVVGKRNGKEVGA